MYEFEVFDDLHSSLVSTTKTKNMSEDAHESSFDSDSTIIETDIDLESIANKYIRDAESTTNDKLNKISLDKEMCNFTKSKSDSALKIQIDSSPESINKLTNSAASSISSASNSNMNSSRSSSFSYFFANKESDPELDSILKKYTNSTSTSDTNTYSSLKRTASSTLSHNINTNSTTSVSNTNISSLKRTASSTLSRNINEEPIELSSDDDLPQIQVKTVQSPTVKSYMSEFNFDDDRDDENLWNKYKIPNDEPCTSSALQSLKNPEKDPVQDDLISCSSPKKKRKVNPDKADKEKRKIERAAQQAKKREETERAKKLKQALSAANKNMKPEECMKFITVFLDTDIANEKYGGEILNALQTADVTYRLQSQLIPHTVTWNRKVQKHNVDDNGELIEISETVETNEVLLIINWDKIVELVHSQSLRTHVESVKSTLMNKKISLGIYGLDNYFKYQKNQKQRDMRSEIAETSQKSKSKFDKIYKDAPKINKKQLEMALTELQILCSCCYRKVDTPQDIGAMIAQYTKTIAQAPYKLEKHQKQQEAEWYMCGDNKDCVSVDKNGNGLQRLWQQQLTTFPLARLEHAEAIAAQYSTPLNLMKVYQQISPEQGEKLLKDIPIRRAAGPLTTVRKIGPELSKKIYTFFTSKNGDLLL